MAPAELCGVWQMRVNGLTGTFCLVYLDVPDCSNGIGTTVPSNFNIIFGRQQVKFVCLY